MIVHKKWKYIKRRDEQTAILFEHMPLKLTEPYGVEHKIVNIETIDLPKWFYALVTENSLCSFRVKIECKITRDALHHELNDNDRVYVRQMGSDKWVRRYFNHWGVDGLVYTYAYGKDKWSSGGKIGKFGWRFCQKAM